MKVKFPPIFLLLILLFPSNKVIGQVHCELYDLILDTLKIEKPRVIIFPKDRLVKTAEELVNLPTEELIISYKYYIIDDKLNFEKYRGKSHFPKFINEDNEDSFIHVSPQTIKQCEFSPNIQYEYIEPSLDTFLAIPSNKTELESDTISSNVRILFSEILYNDTTALAYIWWRNEYNIKLLYSFVFNRKNEESEWHIIEMVERRRC